MLAFRPFRVLPKNPKNPKWRAPLRGRCMICSQGRGCRSEYKRARRSQNGARIIFKRAPGSSGGECRTGSRSNWITIELDHDRTGSRSNWITIELDRPVMPSGSRSNWITIELDRPVMPSGSRSNWITIELDRSVMPSGSRQGSPDL